MKKHGYLWWLCISWWWLPIKWICYSIPMFVIRKLIEGAPDKTSPQKPTESNTKRHEPYVYIVTGGKKYHYDRLCPSLRNAKEIKMDLSKARKAGYTACAKCCYDYMRTGDAE